MFKVKGLWVAPIEIEAALTGHPAVREAAVVSCTDADGFTRPMAYVVLRQGFSQGHALIVELCAAVRALGGYKVPARYAFIDELPRATSLKIDRRAAATRLTRRRSLPRIVGTEQRRRRWSAGADSFKDRVESRIDSSDISRADG